MDAVTPAAPNERNLACVLSAFGAVGAGDVDGQLARYTDDAVLEMPFADPPVRIEGKPALRSRLEPALAIFHFTLSVTEVHECAEPDTLVLEYTSQGVVTTTGRPYANAYIGVFRFREGLICFQREYYNPVAAQRALAAR